MRNGSSELWALAVMLASVAVIVGTGLDEPLIDAALNAEAGEWLGFWGGIFGGLFTVLAAYIAWRSVKPQIDEARKQTAAAVRSIIERSASELEGERHALLNLRGAAKSADDYANGDQRYDDMSDLLRRAGTAAKSFKHELNSVEAFFFRNPEGTRLFSERSKLISVAKELSGCLSIHYKGLLHDTYGGDAEEEEIPPEEYREADLGMRALPAEVMAATDELIPRLDEEIGRVWKRLRELEAVALGTTAS